MAGEDMEHADMIEKWKNEWEPPMRAGRNLRGHQKAAVAFLHHCQQNFGFALLGDAMGIGKVYLILLLLNPDD